MKDLYRNWILASRPWSFTMTLMSVGVGSAIAAADGVFHWGLFIATLIGAVCLHAATNLLNDYHDVKSGVDTDAVATAKYRPHPLLEKKLELRAVARVAYALFLVGAIIGVWLALERGWPVLLIGALGVLAGIAYTAPPVKYKHFGFGELSVFLMWGPLMVEGTYYVQQQSLSWRAFWVSIPFGLLVGLVILANNLRDCEYDNKKDVRTLAVMLGGKGGFYLYSGLVVTAYFCILLMVLIGILPIWSLAVLLSLPLAIKLFRVMSRKIPDDADARTAQINTVFGILLIASLLVEVWI